VASLFSRADGRDGYWIHSGAIPARYTTGNGTVNNPVIKKIFIFSRDRECSNYTIICKNFQWNSRGIMHFSLRKKSKIPVYHIVDTNIFGVFPPQFPIPREIGTEERLPKKDTPLSSLIG
jgi:hypothetical protein